jgi:hypothetical protein
MTTITTNTTATAAGPILAIDLGKYKSVVCVYCVLPPCVSRWYTARPQAL